MNILSFLTESCLITWQMPSQHHYATLIQNEQWNNAFITQSSINLFNTFQNLPVEVVHDFIKEKRVSLCAAPYEFMYGTGIEVSAYSRRKFEDIPEEDSLAYYDLLLYKVLELALNRQVSNDELEATNLIPLINTLIRNIPDLNAKVFNIFDIESDHQSVLDILLSNHFLFSRFRGLLTCSQPHLYFETLLSWRKGQDPPIREHFLMLSLFIPTIQIELYKTFIEKYPELKNLMVRIVPFYPLDVAALNFVLAYGAQLEFESESGEEGDLGFSLSSERYLNLIPVLEDSVSSLKDNFIDLLIQQIFFEFDHEILQKYLDLFPAGSSNYAAKEYLASLLLFNPSKRSLFALSIEDLIDHQFHLNLLASGTPDLLAVLSLMLHRDNEMFVFDLINDFIENFSKKERKFDCEKFSNESVHQTIFFPSQTEGQDYRVLPNTRKNYIKNFFLMCCKVNLNESAFEVLLNFFMYWTKGDFIYILKRGLMIAESKGFEVKKSLLSRKIEENEFYRNILYDSYFLVHK